MTAADVPASRAKRILAATCGVHALHDGLIDGILIFLPIFQSQFSLSYGLVGLMRAMATGTMAAGQIPVGTLADRLGSRTLLVAGTALAGFGYLCAGLGGSFAGAVAGLVLIGLGASVQHPVASELIAASRDGAARRMALGIYNFSGDVGKMTLPPLAAVLILVFDWRIVCAILCAIAVAVSAGLRFALPADAPHVAALQTPKAEGDATPNTRPFRLLIAIGIFDSATRMAFLTFLPFLLVARGGTVETTGLALSLLFAGGAAGKFVCAWLGARIGPIASVVVSEVLTALAIVAVVVAPLGMLLALLPLLGVALNGTSSILYGSVAELVPESSRRRGFAMFYTATVGSGAVAPILAGAIVDHADLGTMLFGTALIALFVVPLAIGLRPAFEEQSRA